MCGVNTDDLLFECSGKPFKNVLTAVFESFRNFGLNKNIMQENILIDVADLLKMINHGIDSGEVELNIREMIEMRVGSVINCLLLGYRFDENKKDEFKIVKGRKDFANF